MSEPIYLKSSEFIDLLIDEPRLGDVLLDCVNIQPELDPEAGFGVMQAYMLLKTLELGHAPANALCEKANNPYKFYVFLRAVTLMYVQREQVEPLITGPDAFNYEDMLTYIASVCKLFNVGLAKLHI